MTLGTERNGTSILVERCTPGRCPGTLGQMALLDGRAVDEVDPGQSHAISHSQFSATAVPMPATGCRSRSGGGPGDRGRWSPAPARPSATSGAPVRPMCTRAHTANPSPNTKRTSPTPARHGSVLSAMVPKRTQADQKDGRRRRSPRGCAGATTTGRGLSSWRRRPRASRARTPPIRRRRRARPPACDQRPVAGRCRLLHVPRRW